MKDLQNLLTQISITNKKNDELLEAVGGRFNMFRLLGVDHYENTHSSILAELLNPYGSHGLKACFLHAFYDSMKLKEYIRDFDFGSVIVKTEVQVENGRIDILIEDNRKHAIIIENKIYAGDQWEQLKRYNEFAIRKYGPENYKIAYLTLYGSEASKNSGEKVDYLQISYSNEIILWLEQCLSLSVRYPLVRETICQYINHIKKLTNQDMDKKNKEDIVKILSSSNENLEAAFSIVENIAALKDYIISNYFNPQMHDIAKELNLIYSSELKNKAVYTQFKFDVPKWNYFRIRFEFDGSYWTKLSVMYELKDLGNIPKETVTELYTKFKSHNDNKNIPCGYTYLSKYCNWDNDALLAIVNGEMKYEIKRIVENLLEQAKNSEM